jgi:protein-disulfide isomerase
VTGRPRGDSRHPGMATAATGMLFPGGYGMRGNRTMLTTMRRLGAMTILAAALAFGGVATARADDALSPAQADAVKKLVHDYLLEHPDVILDSLKALDERQQAGNQAEQHQVIAQRKAELFEDPASPVLGNPQGSVTIVEFFDYRCPYCKGMAKDLSELVHADGNIRLIYKDFPILGPASLFASKAALAAQRQGKYMELHQALMGFKGQIADDTVLDLAKRAGLDMERLKADMEGPEIAAQIRKNYDLATALKISGTPGFIIGDSVVDGAMPMDKMKELVAAQRKG